MQIDIDKTLYFFDENNEYDVDAIILNVNKISKLLSNRCEMFSISIRSDNDFSHKKNDIKRYDNVLLTLSKYDIDYHEYVKSIYQRVNFENIDEKFILYIS